MARSVLGVPWPFFVADEIIVDDKRRMKSGSSHVFEFGEELLRFFCSGLTTVNHYDVAKLTTEMGSLVNTAALLRHNDPP